MVDYTVAISASNGGGALNVRINLQYDLAGAPISRWETTPFSLDLADGTELIMVPDPVHSVFSDDVPTCYKFKLWTGDIDDPPGQRVQTLVVDAAKTVVVTYEKQTSFPTQSPTRRISKYDAKTDEEVAASRVTALKPMMVEQAKAAYASQVSMEQKIGSYLYNAGLYGHQLHHYRNFAQAILRLRNMFYGQTLTLEVQALGDLWAAKDLEPTHLVAIAKLFGITITIA